MQGAGEQRALERARSRSRPPRVRLRRAASRAPSALPACRDASVSIRTASVNAAGARVPAQLEEPASPAAAPGAGARARPAAAPRRPAPQRFQASRVRAGAGPSCPPASRTSSSCARRNSARRHSSARRASSKSRVGSRGRPRARPRRGPRTSASAGRRARAVPRCRGERASPRTTSDRVRQRESPGSRCEDAHGGGGQAAIVDVQRPAGRVRRAPRGARSAATAEGRSRRRDRPAAPGVGEQHLGRQARVAPRHGSRSGPGSRDPRTARAGREQHPPDRRPTTARAAARRRRRSEPRAGASSIAAEVSLRPWIAAGAAGSGRRSARRSRGRRRARAPGRRAVRDARDRWARSAAPSTP